jgi:hypothetical protein
MGSGLIAMLLAATAMLPSPGYAQSETWPSKPIRMVIPYPAGGSADSVGRLLALKLGEKIGQPVIVDNKPGASGNIGTLDVLRAKADGYTLLFNPSIHVINPILMEKAPYRTVEDFTEIALIAKGPLVLVVTNGLQAKSVQEFIGLAKSNPKSVSFATSVIGSASHLAEEMFKRSADAEIIIVPYKGNAPALNDLIGGQVSAMMDPAVTALPLVKAGKLRALAVTSKQRLEIAPEIPTVAEAGIPDFEFYTWYGLWGPAQLPAPIASKLSAAVIDIMKTTEVKEKLASQGLQAEGGSAKAFRTFIDQETSKYDVLIKKANIRP